MPLVSGQGASGGSPGFTPEETPEFDEQKEMERIDREMARKQAIFGDLSNMHLGDLGQKYGIKEYSNRHQWIERAAELYGGGMGALTGGIGASSKTKAFRKREELTASAAQDLRNQITAELADLARQKQEAITKGIDTRVARIAKKEEGLKSQLLGAEQGINSAIDQNLNNLLSETGYLAGKARQNIGSQAADVGMSRSSGNVNALTDVTLNEQEEKSGLRMKAQTMRDTAAQTVKDSITGIEKTREGLAIRRNLAELQSFEQVGFDLDVQGMKQKFEMDLQNMEIDASRKDMFNKLAGGVLSGAAKIFSGGLL